MKIYIEFNNVISHVVEVFREPDDDYESATIEPVKIQPTSEEQYYCLCLNPPSYKPLLQECVAHKVEAKEIVKDEVK
jgi:hypothetical protein